MNPKTEIEPRIRRSLGEVGSMVKIPMNPPATSEFGMNLQVANAEQWHEKRGNPDGLPLKNQNTNYEKLSWEIILRPSWRGGCPWSHLGGP
jgi:hypothetical protein